MASKSTKKKKDTTPAGTPPVKRFVDLTENKTSQEATNFRFAVNKQFIANLKNLHIPVADMYATNSKLLDTYFIARNSLSNFMDESRTLLDFALIDAMIEVIYETQLKRFFLENVIPGRWTEESVKVLMKRYISIVYLSDKPENGPYLSAQPIDPANPQITSDMVETAPAMTFWRFADYNPNRLYQFSCVVSSVIRDTVVNAIQHGIPNAYCNYKTMYSTVSIRMGYELIQIVKPAFEKWTQEVYNDGNLSPDAKAAKLCEELYLPIMRYVTTLFTESGVGQNYALATVSPTNTTMSLHCAKNDGASVMDIAATKDMLNIQLFAKNGPLKQPGSDKYIRPTAALELPLADLYVCAMSDDPKKTKISNLGGRIKQFLEELVTYAFNMYLCNALIPDPVADDDSEVEPLPLPEMDADSGLEE